jgi:hypothetical protein
MIAKDKEKIFNQAIESILGRAKTPSDVIDFDIVKEQYSHREWLRYKNKTVGYFDMGYITDADLQPKLNLNFYFTANDHLDRNIALIKERQERAKKEENERQDKIWEAAAKSMTNKEVSYNGFKNIEKRLRELGFIIEMKGHNNE